MRAILPIIPLTIGLVSCGQKPATPSQADAVPPKFTPEEVAQSLTLLARESEKGKARFAALDAVRDSAPYVSEFVRLFPGTEVNYRYFTSAGEPGFDVGVDLHDRYEFTMQLPVRFDSERKVIGYGEPKFYLVEAASQKGRETAYNPAGERRFGPAEWRTMVERGGDFSAIGYLMITNQPVAGFRDRKTRYDMHGHGDKLTSQQQAAGQRPDEVSNARPTVYESLLPTETDRQRYHEFFGGATNIESMVEWRLMQIKSTVRPEELQRWAVGCIERAESEPNNSKFWSGVGIKSNALPAKLSELGGLVAAAVVRDGRNEPHARIAWRSVDSFWGVAAGDPHFRITDHTLVIKEWQPGLFVWHSK